MSNFFEWYKELRSRYIPRKVLKKHGGAPCYTRINCFLWTIDNCLNSREVDYHKKW